MSPRAVSLHASKGGFAAEVAHLISARHEVRPFKIDVVVVADADQTVKDVGQLVADVLGAGRL